MIALKKKMSVMLVMLLTVLSFSHVSAQSVQVPNIFLNNETRVSGKASVLIETRKDATHSGTFYAYAAVGCAPPAYPSGTVYMEIDMSDSSIKYFRSSTIDEVSSTGKHSPVAFIMGRCETEPAYEGCRFWLKIANNKAASAAGTPDVVGFLVLDGNGNRLAYGTGPVVNGDMFVMPK